MPDIEKKYLDYEGLSEYHDLLSDSIDTKISNINTFTGATSSTAGAKGLVPPPAAGDQDKFLKGDGTWAAGGGGSSLQNFKDGANGATIENDVTNNIASGNYAHAEGYNTLASGYGSHIEGGLLTTENTSPVTLGLYEIDSEGQIIKSSDLEIDDEKNYFFPPIQIIPFGFENPSDLGWVEQSEPDIYIWTEDTTVDNEKEYYQVSPIPMLNTHEAKGWFSHAENMGTVTSGGYTHAEGLGTSAIGEVAHAEGSGTIAIGYSSHTEGETTIAHGDSSHAEGYETRAMGSRSHAEGTYTVAHGEGSHAEGNVTTAAGTNSHAEGDETLANGYEAHAEGSGTVANGNDAHAEGAMTTANGNTSHAEGVNTLANGENSHAEGDSTTADRDGHAEGSQTYAGQGNHAEGYQTCAIGLSCHTEGSHTLANGASSHVEGFYTTANHNYQHVQGKYNDNKSTTLFEIGNGTATTARSNAFEVYDDGSLSTDNGTTKTKLPVVKINTIINGSVTFTNLPSSGNNMIDFYTSIPGANYTAISTSGTSVTLTYDSMYNGATAYCSITEVR